MNIILSIISKVLMSLLTEKAIRELIILIVERGAALTDWTFDDELAKIVVQNLKQ